MTLQFNDWDRTDGAAASSRVDLSLYHATGGDATYDTAYRAANESG